MAAEHFGVKVRKHISILGFIIPLQIIILSKNCSNDICHEYVAQHLPHVPTCVLRGVLEEHTTPESLQMISNLLSKQAGSSQHDSQVHVYDAVGRPIYTHNRNSKILKNCEMGK